MVYQTSQPQWETWREEGGGEDESKLQTLLSIFISLKYIKWLKGEGEGVKKGYRDMEGEGVKIKEASKGSRCATSYPLVQKIV